MAPSDIFASNRMQLVRDPVYYSYDEFVIFKIENVLYRILKSILTSQSKFFKDMFSPHILNSNKEGSTDSTPVILEQVPKAAFDRLLSLIITGSVDTSDTTAWHSDHWISVLRLADKWRMTELKRIALDHLKLKATPEVKIMVGEKFEDESLTKSGILDFCLQATSMEETKAVYIDLGTAIKCAAIRERIWIKAFETTHSFIPSPYMPLMEQSSRHSSSAYAETAKRHASAYVEEAFPSGYWKVKELK